jgi:hypothetical protein
MSSREKETDDLIYSNRVFRKNQESDGKFVKRR